MVSLDATTTSRNQYNQMVRCDLIAVSSSVPPAMTGVPSRAAREVSEKNDGLRSKTPFGTVGTAPGAWQGTSKVEQAGNLTPGRLSRIDQSNPHSPSRVLRAVYYTRYARACVFAVHRPRTCWLLAGLSRAACIIHYACCNASCISGNHQTRSEYIRVCMVFSTIRHHPSIHTRTGARTRVMICEPLCCTPRSYLEE